MRDLAANDYEPRTAEEDEAPRKKSSGGLRETVKTKEAPAPKRASGGLGSAMEAR